MQRLFLRILSYFLFKALMQGERTIQRFSYAASVIFAGKKLLKYPRSRRCISPSITPRAASLSELKIKGSRTYKLCLLKINRTAILLNKCTRLFIILRSCIQSSPSRQTKLRICLGLCLHTLQRSHPGHDNDS